MPKAVLLTINYKTENVMWSFVEGEQAISKANALWASIENDWPGYVSIVTGNKETVKEKTEHVLNLMGLM